MQIINVLFFFLYEHTGKAAIAPMPVTAAVIVLVQTETVTVPSRRQPQSTQPDIMPTLPNKIPL